MMRLSTILVFVGLLAILAVASEGAITRGQARAAGDPTITVLGTSSALTRLFHTGEFPVNAGTSLGSDTAPPATLSHEQVSPTTGRTAHFDWTAAKPDPKSMTWTMSALVPRVSGDAFTGDTTLRTDWDLPGPGTLKTEVKGDWISDSTPQGLVNVGVAKGGAGRTVQIYGRNLCSGATGTCGPGIIEGSPFVYWGVSKGGIQPFTFTARTPINKAWGGDGLLLTATFIACDDGVDNDGDGEVDEEKIDGHDDDGDGFSDEDPACPKKKLNSVEFTQAIQKWQSLEDLKADLADGKPPVPMVAGKPAVMTRASYLPWLFGKSG